MHARLEKGLITKQLKENCLPFTIMLMKPLILILTRRFYLCA